MAKYTGPKTICRKFGKIFMVMPNMIKYFSKRKYPAGQLWQKFKA